jgi:hypothetical protein
LLHSSSLTRRITNAAAPNKRVRLITAHFVSISPPHHVKTLSRQWRDASDASVMCDVGFFHVTKPPLFMTKQNSNTNHQHIVVV